MTVADFVGQVTPLAQALYDQGVADGKAMVGDVAAAIAVERARITDAAKALLAAEEADLEGKLVAAITPPSV